MNGPGQSAEDMKFRQNESARAETPRTEQAHPIMLYDRLDTVRDQVRVTPVSRSAGTYRVVYRIDEDKHTVTIQTIKHRRDAYRP